MRYLIVFVFAVYGFAACDKPVKGRNGVIYKTAVQYNDYIVGRQSTLMQNVHDFGKVAETNLDSATKMLNKFAARTATMIEEIKGMPSYKGDSALRDAAVSSFNFYKNVFENDYMQIITIRKKGIDITPEDAAEANRIIQKITQDEQDFDKRFHNAQKDFAEKNNMKLTENKIQQKIDKLQ